MMRIPLNIPSAKNDYCNDGLGAALLFDMTIAAHIAVPQRVVTRQFVMRIWHPADAPLLMEAIGASISALDRWTPWVIPAPFDIAGLAQRLTKFHDDFSSGQHFVYALLDPEETRVLGSAGLYGRVGPRAFEIGYWIRSDVTGRGFASEASAELTRIAFANPCVEQLEIRCDPDNLASIAIPRRLGFTLREVQQIAANSDQAARQLMVWELLASEYASEKVVT